jgi:hypothetical protein
MSEPGDPLAALRRLPVTTAGQPCPEAERWIELLRGRLDAAEEELLRQHLEGCPACAATARDAHQFLVALGELAPSRRSARRPWALGVAAALALVAVGTAVRLRTAEWRRLAADPVAALAAELNVPAPPVPEPSSVDSELVFRGEEDERARSLAAALVPYRQASFTRACTALAAHGGRFPTDREARYLAAVACLKAGDADHADALLAGLSGSAGDRRADAGALLGRLRQARAGRGE